MRINKTLMRALLEEQSIFQSFNSSQKIGPFKAFYSPNTNMVPHWNMVYPVEDEFDPRDAKYIDSLIKFYEEKCLQGHMLFTTPDFKSPAAEKSEYFIFDKKSVSGMVNENISHRLTSSTAFIDIISTCFDLDGNTRHYFSQKMHIMASKSGSVFYTIYRRGEPIGACSTFRTRSESDFLFNVGILPKFSGSGGATEIVSYVTNQSKKPLYTYSHNPVMRNKILPKIGFKSIGEIWVVPLKELNCEK